MLIIVLWCGLVHSPCCLKWFEIFHSASCFSGIRENPAHGVYSWSNRQLPLSLLSIHIVVEWSHLRPNCSSAVAKCSALSVQNNQVNYMRPITRGNATAVGRFLKSRLTSRYGIGIVQWEIPSVLIRSRVAHSTAVAIYEQADQSQHIWDDVVAMCRVYSVACFRCSLDSSRCGYSSFQRDTKAVGPATVNRSEIAASVDANDVAETCDEKL